jgi:DNA-binding transcriptional MerR regulator
MKRHRTYRVSEVANATGVSVRALHYYDEIGLLVSRERTGAGYRLYDDDDLLRLQQILIGREQGLALEEIEAMDIAERHRLSINRWFYPCSVAMHADLADGYEADSRFAENIDKLGAGLTPFLSAAIRANARR